MNVGVDLTIGQSGYGRSVNVQARESVDARLEPEPEPSPYNGLEKLSARQLRQVMRELEEINATAMSRAQDDLSALIAQAEVRERNEAEAKADEEAKAAVAAEAAVPPLPSSEAMS